MAMKPAGKPGFEGEEGSQIHRIRITLTSKSVKSLEKGEVLQRSKSACDLAAAVTEALACLQSVQTWSGVLRTRG